jgi:peptide/nickel transport system permease protein
VAATEGVCVEPARPALTVRLMRAARRYPAGVAAAAAIVVLLMAAVAPSWLVSGDPAAQDPSRALQPPSSRHRMGTDNFGRDVATRVVHGARASLFVGVGATALALLLAVAAGTAGALAGGVLDAALLRLIDALMALPWLLLVLSVMALLGPGTLNTAIVIGVLSVPAAARVVRGISLVVAAEPYVDAARAAGAGPLHVLARHVLPNIAPEVIVLAAIGAGSAILAESSLSFLGFGVVPPAPAWGYMLGIEGRRFMLVAPWLVIAPGAAIALTVLAFNTLADALRDALDPYL